jgi:hypothetical protein
MSIVISTTQVTHRELELDVERPAAKPIGLRRTSVQPSSGTLSQGILRGGPLIPRLNYNHLPYFLRPRSGLEPESGCWTEVAVPGSTPSSGPVDRRQHTKRDLRCTCSELHYLYPIVRWALSF